jgi:hypothetical protein
MEGSLQAEQVQFPGLTHLFICLRKMGLGRGCGILGCRNKLSIYSCCGNLLPQTKKGLIFNLRGLTRHCGT